jgi:hypothetical protein
MFGNKASQRPFLVLSKKISVTLTLPKVFDAATNQKVDNPIALRHQES